MKNNRDGVKRNQTGKVTRTILGDSPSIQFSGPEGRTVTDAMSAQLELFKEKFGREPNDDDPLFFDPDFDEPTPISSEKMEFETVKAMQKIGAVPALIYAYQQTGLIAAEASMSLMTEDEMDEHVDAVERYRALHN